MKEKVLFHLRGGGTTVNSKSTHSNDTDSTEQSKNALPKAQASEPIDSNDNSSEQPPLDADSISDLCCTCVHSSSPSCVVVGFEQGVVHVYDRVLLTTPTGSPHLDELERCEEERWRHTPVYPTRALSSSYAGMEPADITCVQRGPSGILAIGTANGFVFFTTPPEISDRKIGAIGPSSFHHKSHKGRRVNCLLWDPSGDKMYSVCDGGIVILAENLLRRRKNPSAAPGGMATVVNSLVPLLGGPAVKVAPWNETETPRATEVKRLGSPGVQLDLGRTKTAIPGFKRNCDVLLVMTRQRAVLLYFPVGEDVRVIAPYEATVDLNIIGQSVEDPTGSSEGEPDTEKTPAPPSTADLGGCLWGPPQAPDATRRPSAGRGAMHGPGALGDEPLHQAFRVGGTPRTVAFAYVAQPGGRLWRVGLADGEVESTFRPSVFAYGDGVNGRGGRDEGGTTTHGFMEIGHMRTVLAGDSQCILCWRSGIQSGDKNGDIALLDPAGHKFVDACQGLRNVIGLSGDRLSLEGVIPSDATLPIRSSGAMAPVRFLRGGGVPKVCELYVGGEGETDDGDGASGDQRSSPASSVAGDLHVPAGLALEDIGAESVQEAVDAEKPVDTEEAVEGSVEEGAAIRIQRAWRERRRKRLAAWQASIVPPYNFKTKPATPGGEMQIRAPSNAAVRGATRGRTHRSSGGRLAPKRPRYERGARALADGQRGEDGFSILDSLGAVDAAERVLRLSNGRHDRDDSIAAAVRSASAPCALPGERSDISNVGEGDGEGESSGSGEDASARPLVRTVDELLRETAPLLRRRRSLLVFSPPQESPLAGRTSAPALDGWDGPERGMLAAAALAAEESRLGMMREARAAAESDGDHGAVVMGGAEKSTTSGGQTDVQSSGSRVSPPPTSTSPGIPNPTFQGRETGAEASAGSPWSSSKMPFPKLPERARREHASPRARQNHKNLLGPMQNVMGALLQRAGQAMNHALQPGGGAASDDSSPWDGEGRMFAHEQHSSHEDLSGMANYDHEAFAADGDMTSDTGKTVYSAQFSSDSYRSDYRSDVEEGMNSHRSTSAATASSSRGQTQLSFAQDPSLDEQEKGGKSVLKADERSSKDNGMLLVAGMTGSKRRSLSTVRSRRDARLKTGVAAVAHLPRSELEDPSPFLPPSQYEVHLDLSKGLGMSVYVKGNNEPRVTGFHSVDGEMSPAEACGQIQVGDIIVGVEKQQLASLSHNRVTEVLRGLNGMSGTVLLRFQYEQESQSQKRQSHQLPPTRIPPKETPPNPQRMPSTATNLSSYSKDDAFRAESWHGPRPTDGRGRMLGGAGRTSEAREHARSVSPPHGGRGGSSASSSLTLSTSASYRRRSFGLGLGDDGSSRSLGLRWSDGEGQRGSAHAADGLKGDGGGVKRARSGSETVAVGQNDVGDEGIFESSSLPASAGGNFGRGGTENGDLWGQHELGDRSGAFGGRHVYLADMGHASAQKTLGHIAQDVQGLHCVKAASEQVRFFHGRSRLSLADPSPHASENRIPPPSALMHTTAGEESTNLTHSYAGSAEAPGTLEEPPPMPPRPLRGKRRRRPRRRRSLHSLSNVDRGSEDWGDEDGNGEADEGGVIDIGSCRQVIESELWRLERGLEKQQTKLARRARRSSVDGLVSKILLQRSTSSTDDPRATVGLKSSDSISPRAHRRRLGKLKRAPSKQTANSHHTSWRRGRESADLLGELSPTRLSEGHTDDSDNDGVCVVDRWLSGGRRGSGQAGTVLGGGSQVKKSVERKGPQPTCDIEAEYVRTGLMQQEMMEALPTEMLGIGPAKPIPPYAHDLQTALESVQHFATQTLAGVVQSEATRGAFGKGFDDSETFSQRSRSRSPMRGVGGARAAEAALLAKEEAKAAGTGEEWEKAWPPRALTAALALVTANQMRHAMRCDSEPLVQVWMRCFTPLDAKHRDKLWAALSPAADDTHDKVEGVYHRQLVCGLVTLFAQVHISWSFLARPSDDPSTAVGIMSLRLRTTWFGSKNNRSSRRSTNYANGNINDGSSHGAAAESVPQSPASANVEAMDAGDGWGCEEGAQAGPEQWDEEKMVDFFQDHGCYLDADALAASASCRESSWALHEVLNLAAQCQHHRERERHLHQLIGDPTSPVGRPPNPTSPPMTPTMLRSPDSTPGTRSPTMNSPFSPSPHSLGVSPLTVATAMNRASTVPSARSNINVATRPMEEAAVRKVLGLKPARIMHGCTAGVSASDLNIGREFGDVPQEDIARRAVGDGGKPLEEGDDTTAEDYRLGSSPLCLLLKNLAQLFRWDTASAAEICADFFPGIRPWNVHHALHQACPWGLAEPTTPLYAATPGSTQGRYSAAAGDSDIGTRYDAAFHAYLWATIQREPSTCRRDWKMVQRCLQLSLRIGTRLRSLPSSHPLHYFCLAATRNFARDSVPRNTRQEQGSSVVSSPVVESSTGVWHTRNLQNRQLLSFSAVGGVDAETRSDGGFDVSACQRYSHIVEELVMIWCRDSQAIELDPLWLLQKLRAYKNWPLVFRLCAGVSRSWEDPDRHEVFSTDAAHNDDPAQPSKPPLASVLTVLDALAEACFANFEDGNTTCLASALTAIWAADGALRRAAFEVSDVGEGVRQTADDAIRSLGFDAGVSASGRESTGEMPQGVDNADGWGPVGKSAEQQPIQCGAAVAALRDDETNVAVSSGFEADDEPRGSAKKTMDEAGGRVALRSDVQPDDVLHDGGNASTAAWIHDSRTVDILASLTQRCRDYRGNTEESGERGSTTVEQEVRRRGRRDSVTSASGVDEWLSARLSLLELAEALADGVGPEAAGVVLSACPSLLERLPPEFFHGLADRQAALYRQRALEATLLEQASAAVWAFGGQHAHGGGSMPLGNLLGRPGGRAFGVRGDRTSPLGPRLSWLACEELASFFQQNEDAIPDRGAEMGQTPLPALLAPPAILSSQLPVRRLFGPAANIGKPNDNYNASTSNTINRQQRWSSGVEEVLGHAVNKAGLNFVLPGRAHEGASLVPGSPCAYCGLPLSGPRCPLHSSAMAVSGVSASFTGFLAGGAESVEVAIAGCGHGYHMRCFQEGQAGFGVGGPMDVPCPICL